ncbi:MAG: hypothetical protein ACYC2Z_09480 [Candidatus Nanopelagicales bacterium]
MSRSGPPGFVVQGPVQTEVFVLWLDGEEPRLTGPCGAEPWYREVGTDEDPLAVVASAVRRVTGDPAVAHSLPGGRIAEARS